MSTTLERLPTVSNRSGAGPAPPAVAKSVAAEPAADARSAEESCLVLQPGGKGAMWIDRRFAERLQSEGLGDFEAVMANVRGRCLRMQAVRENWYLPSRGPRRPPPGLYLKKHHERTWMTRWRARWGWGPGTTPARIEVRNVLQLAAAGVPAMRVVAYGERLDADGRQDSFLLTEELRGFDDLETVLRRHVPVERVRPRRCRDRRLLALLAQVARVARRFHDAGYNHRDFYTAHIFVRPTGATQHDVRLIDLHRVQRRRWRRRRWIVKDLAQLAWSAPVGRLTASQRMFFIKCYLGVRRLRARDRRLIREVLFKQQIMTRRLGPIE